MLGPRRSFRIIDAGLLPNRAIFEHEPGPPKNTRSVSAVAGD
jgi:hypothetical protein